MGLSRDSAWIAARQAIGRHGRHMPTLTIQIDRREVLRRLEQNDAYGFLALATPYLSAIPEDGYVRLMAAREYLRLGLIGPGREILESSNTESETNEWGALRRAVAALPDGSVPWASRAALFQRNLTALERRGVDVDSLRRSWESEASAFELYRDANGEDQIRRRDAVGEWEWVPALRRHEQVESAEPMPEGVGGMTPGPFLFEGVGRGKFLKRVLHATANSFHGFSCAIYIVEAEAATFAAWLHLADWTGVLDDRRVRCFVGESWSDDLQRSWSEELDLPLPRTVLTLGTRRNSHAISAAAVVQLAHESREEEINRSFAELEARYAERDRAYWSRRFDEALSGRGQPLRVLAAVSTHTTFLQYSMRDAQRALESLGHRCVVLTEGAAHEIISPLTYHRAIRELDPDLFFNIDHLRPEFPRIVPSNLPILTWDQDQLPQVITTENLRQLAEHDFVVGCSKPQALRLGANSRQFRYTQMPTCPEQFGGPPLTEEESERFACDVSYVSHASQTPLEFHEQERKAWADIGLARLLDVLYESFPRRMPPHGTATGAVIDEMIAEGLRATAVGPLAPDLEARLRGWYLWRLGDRVFRHAALEWVAGWAQRSGRTLRIYGNGWERHPTLASFSAGPVRNGRELVCVHRASRINLQLMPAGFLHQRALDGLAAGGFFLTRETASDRAAPILRGLLERCRSLGITTTDGLLRSSDEALRRFIHEVDERRLHRVDASAKRLLEEIAVNLEVSYPGEVFLEFESIAFRCRKSFEAAATRFVDDEAARRRIAESMRDVVLARFSYRSAMERFLLEMARYLVGDHATEPQRARGGMAAS